MKIFRDRFSAETYADDEPICFGIKRNGAEFENSAEMPERLFVRCQCLAQAYSLHLLSSINYYETTSLDRTQCQTLVEELEFIQFVVNDPLLESHLPRFKEIALQCAQSPFLNTTYLVIEGP
ncbi:MAG TPA: hypothetical protein VIL74_17035 [Pyrinomonadaceae bacterium]|jgi:hypothetical protein